MKSLEIVSPEAARIYSLPQETNQIIPICIHVTYEFALFGLPEEVINIDTMPILRVEHGQFL